MFANSYAIFLIGSYVPVFLQHLDAIADQPAHARDALFHFEFSHAAVLTASINKVCPCQTSIQRGFIGRPLSSGDISSRFTCTALAIFILRNCSKLSRDNGSASTTPIRSPIS